jgi:hypothetical protein
MNNNTMEMNTTSTPATELAAATEIADLLGASDRAEYLRRERRFQYLLRNGMEPGAWVALERGLISAAQVPSGPKRCDLVAEYSAMRETDDLAEIINVLLDKGLDALDMTRLEDLGVELHEHDHERSVAVVTIEGARDWHDALGGPARVGEIERRFTVHVRRAPWRDRSVRRLSALEVHGVELHPDAD